MLAVIPLHVQSDILSQENKGKSDSLNVFLWPPYNETHILTSISFSISCLCLSLFVSVPFSACLCLSVPVSTCLCLSVPVCTCLCLPLPVSACLCLSLSPGSSLRKHQGIFLEFILSYFKYHNGKKNVFNGFI